MRLLFRHCLVLAFSVIGLGASGVCSAVTLVAATTRLGSAWHTDYTLAGMAPSGGFDGVTVYFSSGSVEQLAISSAPANWDALAIQPDSGLGADGFVDLLNVIGTIAGDISPVLFSVNYRYVGTGTPGPQRFELYRQSPFQTVATGTTQVGLIPEAGTLPMLLLGFGALAVRGVRRGSSRQRGR